MARARAGLHLKSKERELAEGEHPKGIHEIVEAFLDHESLRLRDRSVQHLRETLANQIRGMLAIEPDWTAWTLDTFTKFLGQPTVPEREQRRSYSPRRG